MIEVEIWSDFVCPFCSIGKRNFEKALLSFANRDQVQVTYKCFELNPNAEKSQKRSIDKLLAEKYGQTEEWAKQRNTSVVKMAAQAGLDFKMDQVIPTNSFDAHRLSFIAAKAGKQSEWQEQVMTAYFTKGLDIANPEVLQGLAQNIGVSGADVDLVLKSDAYTAEVRQDEEQAQQFGIQGVPFFVFNREFGVSGAQPPEAFLEVLEKLVW